MRTAQSITLDLLSHLNEPVEVVAFRPFEPYRLQMINLDSTTEHRQRRTDAYQAPQYKKAPEDKYEYWDWMQERTSEYWQSVKDRKAERQEQREANRQEVLDTVEEVWGRPPMISLRSIQKYSQPEKQEKE
jgi:hypothetical protein